ncbi:MAG TPA: hypothetical protein PLG64_03970 [Bacteroidales bacterium]|jgi:hypothetical protein|nr:hypothetical protein [Bacteroidales bacterium]
MESLPTIKMSDPIRNIILLLLLGAGVTVSSCRGGRQEVAGPLPVIEEILTDTASAHYIDTKAYANNRENLPIGIFGTSVDDLQVVETLLGLDEFDNITGEPGADGIKDFAGEHIDFFCLPPVEDRSREDMIRQIAGLFRWQDQRPPVKALVVAGDMVTMQVYEDIRDLIELGKLGIITVNVMQAGNDKAFSYVLSNRENNRVTVGVISTAGAFSINAYDYLEEKTAVAFQEYAPIKGRSPEKAIHNAVTSLADQLLYNSHPRLKYIILGAPPLQQHREIIPESITFLRNYRSDNRYIYRHLIDSGVILIEPQKEAGIQLYRALRDERLAAFRTTPSCVRVHSFEKPDLTKYPLLNVCINN